MKRHHIKAIFEKLLGHEIAVNDFVQNIYISCPLAPYTHKSGVDNSKGFSIKVDPMNRSPCYCWACGFRGTIYTLIKTIEEYSGRRYTSLLYEVKRYEQPDMEDILFALSEPNKPKERYLDEGLLEGFDKLDFEWRGLSQKTVDAFGLLYDKEKRRVVLPIRDVNNRLVGASGRALFNCKMRWYNYWQFSKSYFLFGEQFFLDTPGTVIILEGQGDALRVYDLLGHKYAVASLMGAKPSSHQIRKIKQHFTSAILCLDNDQTGAIGTRILASQLIKDLDLRTVIWSCFYKDPGDENLPANKLIEMIENSVPILPM